jgi:hypothetical protein
MTAGALAGVSEPEPVKKLDAVAEVKLLNTEPGSGPASWSSPSGRCRDRADAAHGPSIVGTLPDDRSASATSDASA